MNPWINVILLIPALLIVGIIVLVRIKGKLENKIFPYRQEGIVLHTSLTIFKIRDENERWRISFGLVLLTGHRLIVFDWRRKNVFECKFRSLEKKYCELDSNPDGKNIIIHCRCGRGQRDLTLKVRNPDAWKLEFSRLCSRESQE